MVVGDESGERRVTSEILLPKWLVALLCPYSRPPNDLQVLMPSSSMTDLNNAQDGAFSISHTADLVSGSKISHSSEHSASFSRVLALPGPVSIGTAHVPNRKGW